MNSIEILNKSKSIEKKDLILIAKKVLETFEMKNYEIEIIFLSEREIRNLNKKYRRIDKATDVLSFSQAEIPKSKKVFGTVFICETCLLAWGETATEAVKHGLLHLLGFNHETDPQAWAKALKKID